MGPPIGGDLESIWIDRIRSVWFEPHLATCGQSKGLQRCRLRSVPQTVNEERRLEARACGPLRLREDFERVGLAATATTGEQDERIPLA